MNDSPGMTLDELIEELFALKEQGVSGDAPVTLNANDDEYENPLKRVEPMSPDGNVVLFDT